MRTMTTSRTIRTERTYQRSEKINSKGTKKLGTKRYSVNVSQSYEMDLYGILNALGNDGHLDTTVIHTLMLFASAHVHMLVMLASLGLFGTVLADINLGATGRPIYSDGINLEYWTAAVRDTGVSKSSLLKMAMDSSTTLALAFEPICKHSRSDGKRGLRWDVMVNGKHVNARQPFTRADFNALAPTDVIRIVRVRAATVKTESGRDTVVIDSHGKRLLSAITVKPTVDVPAPAVDAPVTVETPAKPKRVRKSKPPVSADDERTALIESASEPTDGRGIFDPPQTDGAN